MSKITERKFQVKDTTYSYWVEGDDKNQLLILLPGFTGTHGDLIDFARQFKEKYFVIIPDLPGWGESQKGAYYLTIEGYAKFLHDLLAHVAIKEKIILVGHCMGSVVAIEFAQRYPEKVAKLFLISVPYLKGNFSEALFQHLALESEKVPKLFRPSLFFFRSRLFAIPLGFFVIQTRSWRKKLSIMLHNSIKQQFQDEEVTEENWTSLVLFDYNNIKHLSLPIHIFHGEKDILVRPEQAKKLALLCQYATVDSIPHAGHMPPVETPESLGNTIKKYLN